MTRTPATSPGAEPTWEQLLSGAAEAAPAAPAAPSSPPRGTARPEIELPAWERDDEADAPDVVELPESPATGASGAHVVRLPDAASPMKPWPAEALPDAPAPATGAHPLDPADVPGLDPLPDTPPAGSRGTPVEDTPPRGSHVPAPPAPAPATPAERPLTQDLAGTESDQLRELEERVAEVLRHPENLRSVHAPVVDLRTGVCTGYEAAVRVAQWPARDPRPWLQAAARAGLAAQLEAAGLAASLQARLTMPGDRWTVVRVTGTSVMHPAVLRVLDDADDLGRVLVCVAPAPDASPAELIGAVEVLRQHGALAGLCLTEAGRSELVAVEAARPDVVSLERAFSVDVHADRARQLLVRTVVDVVGEGRGAVLAEDVEAIPDARCLRDCGVHLAQGWLFGRPRPGFLPPPADTADWLATPRTDRPGPVPRQRTVTLPDPS